MADIFGIDVSIMQGTIDWRKAKAERIHLGTLASFPRYTHVEQIQDGLTAWMELSCKVIGNR